jgi:hypothetical protein
MAIAHQPAMTAAPDSTRPALPRRPRGLELVDLPPRSWTVARLLGLLVATAVCVALATAIVGGTVLFAVLNIGG